MPSRYEPCGLGQLIAMRYGAVPVVTPTGGLRDTVFDAPRSKKGTGFVAQEVTIQAYLAAVMRGLSALKKKKDWVRLQKQGMRVDHSWDKSVDAYLDLYRDAIGWHRRQAA